MDGCPAESDSAYHGNAMTTFRTAFLACLALTPLAAQAQTHAPAEDRPGRVVLVPMSVERPVGEGWVLFTRDRVSVIYARNIKGTDRNQSAKAFSHIPDKRINSIEALIERLRSDLSTHVNQERYRVLDEKFEIENNSPFKCVRYFHRTEDKQSLNKERPLTISLYGRSCLHPNDEGLVVGTSLTETGVIDQTSDAASLATQFFDEVRFHIPIDGKNWLPLADQGDINAQVWLARVLFQSGKPEEAIGWLVRAADKGHLEAQTLLGFAYLTGRGAKRNPQEAVKWLHKAAEKGYPSAEGFLGWAYLIGPEIRNENEGRRWVRKAVTDGDPFGQRLLGELLISGGSGIEKNEVEGATWVRKAAEQGDARAQYLLASLLYNGVGVGKDFGQSRFWLELAAAQGNPDARKLLDQAKKPAKPAPATAPTESK